MLSGLHLPSSNGGSVALGPGTSIPPVQVLSSTNLATTCDVRSYLLEETTDTSSQNRVKLSSHLQDALRTPISATCCPEKADEIRTIVNALEKPATFTTVARQKPPPQSRPNVSILAPAIPGYPNSRVGNGDSNDGRQLFYLVPASAVNGGSSTLQGVSNNRLHQPSSTSCQHPQAVVSRTSPDVATTPPSITCKIGEKLYRCVEIGKQPSANITTAADGCSSVQIPEVVQSRRPLQQELLLTSSVTSQPGSTCDPVQSSYKSQRAQPGLGPTNMSILTKQNQPTTSQKAPKEIEDDQPKKTTPIRQSLSEGRTVAVASGCDVSSPTVGKTFTELTNYKPRSPVILRPTVASQKPLTVARKEPTVQTHHAAPLVQINENNSSLPRNESHHSIPAEGTTVVGKGLAQQAPSSKPRAPSLEGKYKVVPTTTAISYCQHAGALSSRGRKRRNADRVRRPMNAFMVWARINRPLLARNYEGTTNADISIRLGQAWNALTHEQKEPFYKEAEELKKQHREEYPGWVYTPRAPKQKGNGYTLVPSGDHSNSLPNCKLNPNSTSYFTFSSKPRYVISQQGPVGTQPQMTSSSNAAGAQLQRPGTTVNTNPQYAPSQVQQYVIEPVGPPRRPESAQQIRHATAAGQIAVGQPAVQPVQILLNNPPSRQMIPQNQMVCQARGGAVLHLVNEGRVHLPANHNKVNILKGVQMAHIADLGYGAPPQAESVQATFGLTTGEERKNGSSSSSRSDSSRHPRRCDVDLDDDERSLNLHIPDDGADAAATERRTTAAPDVQLFQRFLSDLSGADQQTTSREWSGAVHPEKPGENLPNDENSDDDDSIINVVT